MKHIYVAGPYTHPDPVINTALAIDAGEKLTKYGFIPFIPHLTLFWHLLYHHDVEFWYFLDLQWLRKCDGLLRLPGQSEGADKEMNIALDAGIPVFFTYEELIAHFVKT